MCGVHILISAKQKDQQQHTSTEEEETPLRDIARDAHGKIT